MKVQKSKPTIVFLHGFLGNKTIWNAYVDGFEEDYNCITYDLPGHGQRPLLIQNDLSIYKVAEDMASVIKAEGIGQFHLVGHSLGGYVGLELLKLIKGNVLSLTLINSTALADSDQKRKERKLAMRVFDMKPELYIEEAVKNLFHKDCLFGMPEVVGMAQNIALSMKPLHAKSYLHAMSNRENNSGYINSIETPVHFIASVHDTTIPFESIAKQIVSANVKLTKLQHSVHMSFLEEPKKTTEAILDFIDRIK